MTSTDPDTTPTGQVPPALAARTTLVGDLWVPQIGLGTMRLTGPEIVGPPVGPQARCQRWRGRRVATGSAARAAAHDASVVVIPGTSEVPHLQETSPPRH